MSEAGQIEFFLFATTKSPKKQQNLLSTITGFINLPPLSMIGYHYSRWEWETSANRTSDFYLKGFEDAGIPLDVVWLDIGHTDGNKYFTFKPSGFKEADAERMNKLGSAGDKRFVVITDPHISTAPNYHVSEEAKQLDGHYSNGKLTSIMARHKDGG